jgi:hypothetical protein
MAKVNPNKNYCLKITFFVFEAMADLNICFKKHKNTLCTKVKEHTLLKINAA